MTEQEAAAGFARAESRGFVGGVGLGLALGVCLGLLAAFGLAVMTGLAAVQP